MLVMSGLLTTIYGVLIAVQRQTADTVKRADSVDQARIGLSQIDRQVRSGNVFYDPVLEALPMSMRVYTQADGIKRCIQWQVHKPSRQLRTRSWQPLAPSTAGAWRVVAHNVQNDVAVSLDQAPFALEGEGSITTYGQRLLRVQFLVKDPTAGGKPVEVRSSLSGRNTQYGFDPGVCAPPTP